MTDEIEGLADNAGVNVAEGDGSASDTGRLDARKLESVLRIPVLMQVVVGSATMPVSNLLKLGRGAVIPLDHRIGEPVDIVINGRVIARGDIVVLEEDKTRFGISLTEIVAPGLDKGH